MPMRPNSSHAAQSTPRTSNRSTVRPPARLTPAARSTGRSTAIDAIRPLLTQTGYIRAMAINPKRTVEELQELRDLTGNADGAQRVAWTDTWEQAREFLRQKVAETGATEEIDEAGNQWFTLRGASERALLIGGHMDSVPNGGGLDGCLNGRAGVGVMRRIAGEGEPPVTVRLVSWADEEGARFGRSLFGSS